MCYADRASESVCAFKLTKHNGVLSSRVKLFVLAEELSVYFLIVEGVVAQSIQWNKSLWRRTSVVEQLCKSHVHLNMAIEVLRTADMTSMHRCLASDGAVSYTCAYAVSRCI
jgi:hypothetical protein